MADRVTVQTDDLNRADELLNQPPYRVTAGSGVADVPPLELISNTARYTPAGESLGSSLHHEALPDDQWSECVVVACPGSDAESPYPQVAGPTVRSSAVRYSYSHGNDGYMFVVADKATTTGGPQDLELRLYRADNSADLLEIVWNGALPGGLPAKLTVEAEGADVRCYFDDALQTTYTDANPLTYTGAGWAIADRGQSPQGQIDDLALGYLIDESQVTVTDVNADDNVASLGPITINGANLSTVSAVEISEAGARAYSLTISGVTANQVTCDPFAITDTQLAYGTLRLTLTHGAGTVDHDVTMLPETGWQYVTTAGLTGQYMDKSVPNIVDGDLLEVPATLSGSTITLFPDGDAHYDPAVPNGATHTRRHYDVSTNTWDSGPVTVNQDAASAPVWRTTPNPPPAYAGVPYSYPIGEILDGTRPMTLTDVGTPLPEWASYNDSAYPETIEGTPPGQTGEVVITGIVTKAENADVI